MKSLLKPLLLLTIFMFTTTLFAQDDKNLVTEADWNKIIPFLSGEQWKDAEKMARTYLNRFKGKDEMSDEAGIVRYMYLKSVGALLGDKVIDKEAALKKLKGFEGKNVITPFITFKNEGMFNYLKLSDEGDNWFQCSANNEATTIHMFETFEMSDKNLVTNPALSEGKQFRLSAIIKSIEANGFTMPRLDVTYSATEIWETE